MKKVTANVFDNVFEVIEQMRGRRPRTEFLRRVVSRGLTALHEEAMRNAPQDAWDTPQKIEGQTAYTSRDYADKMKAVFERAEISLSI